MVVFLRYICFLPFLIVLPFFKLQHTLGMSFIQVVFFPIVYSIGLEKQQQKKPLKIFETYVFFSAKKAKTKQKNKLRKVSHSIFFFQMPLQFFGGFRRNRKAELVLLVGSTSGFALNYIKNWSGICPKKCVWNNCNYIVVYIIPHNGDSVSRLHPYMWTLHASNNSIYTPFNKVSTKFPLS